MSGQNEFLRDFVLPPRRKTPYLLSRNSKKRLNGVDGRLVDLVNEILFYIDVSVIEGLRSVETQKQYVALGVSKTMRSKHLIGKAVDLYPYPVPRLQSGEIDSNSEKWNQLGGVVLTIARAMGIKVQWGGLWTSFIDKPHFEIKEI